MVKTYIRKSVVLYIVFVIVAGVLLSPSTAHSFNSNRKGFVLGFGVGGGCIAVQNSFRYQADYYYKESLYTDFRIGCGLSEKFMVYYTGKQWFGFDNSGWYLGYPAVGVSLYKNKKAPSIVVNAAIGITLGLGVEEVGVGSADVVGSGVNLNVGLGYEWKPNVFWHINVSTSHIGISNILSDLKDHNSWQVALSIDVLKY